MSASARLTPIYIVYGDTADSGCLLDRLRGARQVRGVTFTEVTAELAPSAAQGAEQAGGAAACVQPIVVLQLAPDQLAQGLADALAVHRPPWVILAGAGEALTADLPTDAIVLPDEAYVPTPPGPSRSTALAPAPTESVPTESAPTGENPADSAQAESAQPPGGHPDAAAADGPPHKYQRLSLAPLIRQREHLPKRTFWGALVVSPRATTAESLSGVLPSRPDGGELERVVQLAGWAELVQVCQQASLPWTAVVSVRHTFAQPAAADVQAIERQQNWARKLGATTAALWQRPRVALDLWQEQQRQLQAGDRLAVFLLAVLTPSSDRVG